MAYSQDGGKVAYVADTDLSVTGQYRAVKRTATGIALCGAADAGFLGILQDDPLAGESGTVKTRDVSKAVAGAAVAVGAFVTTDATGRLITAAVGNPRVGRALEAAAAASDLFPIEVGLSGVGA